MGAFEDQLRHDKERLTAALRDAEKELQQRRGADARLRALHVEEYGCCSHCTGLGIYGQPWPCPTITTLNGEPAP